MTPKVAACFPSDPKYREMQLQCIACRLAEKPVSDSKDTEEHVMSCNAYADLRTDLNLDTDKGLVTFFQRVIERRSEVKVDE